MWHPWKRARENHPDVVIDCTRELPGDLAGLTDGRTIWLCRTLSQVQRRCVLTHELVHLERGIVPVESALHEREETIVDEIAARRLISLESLIDALRWTRGRPNREAAWELWTDIDTLTTRVQTLTDCERRIIDEALREVS